MRRLPDFIGMGGVKCGTTWTFNQLAAHPDICRVKKELHFFDWQRFSLPKYQKIFGRCQTKICGEFTPEYFTYPDIPAKIKKLIPNVKLLMSIRHPVERAWSNFKAGKAAGNLPKDISFHNAFYGEVSCSKSPLSTMKNRGMYATNLKNWFSEFPKKQFYFSFYDNILINPKKQLRYIYKWLGVDPKFVSPMIHHHRQKVTPFSHLILPNTTYNEVLDFYMPEIEKLERLIGVNLSHWKHKK